jgi:3-demethoxyubiquinol 3-hydroxylase
MSGGINRYNTFMDNKFRHYSFSDRFCMQLDQAVRAICGNTPTSKRSYPAKDIKETVMNKQERDQAASLMRVNHAGEIAAQALYHAQGFVSLDTKLSLHMQNAAAEEGDHLAWCKIRLMELGSHVSYLTPVWYVGSFIIGMAAGMAGSKYSLGFVAETETQVIKHLQEHIDQLPKVDEKSKAVLIQMQNDEAEHRDEAIQSGAVNLPNIIKRLMRFTAKVMVKTAYWI